MLAHHCALTIAHSRGRLHACVPTRSRTAHVCAQDFRLTAGDPSLSLDLSQRVMLVLTYECVRQWANLAAGVLTGVQEGGRRVGRSAQRCMCAFATLKPLCCGDLPETWLLANPQPAKLVAGLHAPPCASALACLLAAPITRSTHLPQP